MLSKFQNTFIYIILFNTSRSEILGLSEVGIFHKENMKLIS